MAARPAQAEDADRFSGFFGRILSVRGEFGYWVFEGDWQPAQRPSWNYRKEDDGGIIVDMLCHWRYVLDNLFGERQGVIVHRRDAHSGSAGTSAASATTRPPTTPRTRRSSSPTGGRSIVRRSTARGARACAATTSSTFHVDGTLGSAVAGPHRLLDLQPRARRAEARVES